jgi:hypothetical protein
MTIGWKLTQDSRAALLAAHPPRYANAVADHVTLETGKTAANDDVPPVPGSAVLVGHTDDGAGVEAFVVAIDGSTARPDGGTWHVTWSLAEGRHARESNDVIAHGWESCEPEPIALVPASW